MIPVRVRADAMPVLASERRFAANRGHPLDDLPCPVCDRPLGEQVIVLVLAGIAPEDRKPAGVTLGGAVAVHAACAGVPEEEPETPPRTVTFDLSTADARHVLLQSLDEYAAKETGLAADGDNPEKRTGWAAEARRLWEQAEAAAR
jgi:hypothetical protein